MTSHLKKKLVSLREELALSHPELFDLASPVPFRRGIWQDVAAARPDLPRGLIHTLFAWLTNRRAYLRACTTGAIRYGISGPDGEVTEKDAAWAEARLAEREAKASEIRKRLEARRRVA